MRVLILFLGLMNLQILFGQSFEKKLQFIIPPSDTNRVENFFNMQWADINNDSLLDVVLAYTYQNKFTIAAFVNSDSSSWAFKNLISTTATTNTNFRVYDSNKDNRLDFVVFNEPTVSTQVYLNKGNFDFEKGNGAGSAGVVIKDLQIADVDNDTRAEWIWAESTAIRVSTFLNFTFSEVKSFQLFDFDNNGFKDLIASGTGLDSKPITHLWILGDSLRILDTIRVAEISGEIATGDLKHDGYFDVIVAGVGIDGKLTTQAFENKKTSFTKTSTLTGLDSASLQIADFSSDGLADIALRGINSSGDHLNWISTHAGESVLLPVDHLSDQVFGDYDRDGDLDFIQLIEKDTSITNEFGVVHSTNFIFRVYENQSPGNKGPKKPGFAVGLQVYDRMFFYWDKAVDDHTASLSLTYDLKVFSEDSSVVAADFDANHKNRLQVSHGNTGTNNFAILSIRGKYNFEIQAVDNAFVSQLSSICKGISSACTNIDEQEVLACGQAPVILTPPAPQAMWFSFKKGFVGISDSYKFDDTEPDTVFSFNPAANASCSSLRLFNIKPNPVDTLRISHTRYDCIGRNITLEVTPEWSAVSWRNNLNSSIATGQSIVHAFVKEIIFTASASNSSGCKLEEEFILKESKPKLEVNGNQFQIMSGNSIQLIASGGNIYDWTPAASLSDNKIANPLASPAQTTEYTVTAYDSLGCTSTAKILVNVMEEAFIPTLFTPNADGRNDNLRIYGLSQASDFKFAIYNREGNKLFETTNVNEATQVGWSGSVGGAHQPPGTYYWKVEGRSPKGEILLNGKKSGVVLLVR